MDFLKYWFYWFDLYIHKIIKIYQNVHLVLNPWYANAFTYLKAVKVFCLSLQHEVMQIKGWERAGKRQVKNKEEKRIQERKIKKKKLYYSVNELHSCLVYHGRWNSLDKRGQLDLGWPQDTHSYTNTEEGFWRLALPCRACWWPLQW